ncbi:putative transmembrane protein [Toxoplasma gondii CAST]|uniref:Putative transmembrane protein n=1 Tax=Toxoplasma gondii CAST TaxID=943122 RepID=A0A425I0J7_TOXGO|nr:putative transmembrane protein [Toxoplasma gondii CAST]
METNVSGRSSAPGRMESKENVCEFKGIDLSSGRVSNFTVDTPDYTVRFATKQAELIVLPRFECPRNISPQLLPSVFVNGNPVDPRGALGVALPVPLAKRFDVKLEVRNPSSAPSLKVYTLHVDQREAVSEPTLEAFSVQDSKGKDLSLIPLFRDSSDAFVLASGVRDPYISLHAQCDHASVLYIDGAPHVPSSSVKIPREERQPSSLTTIQCRRTGEGEESQRMYFLETQWTSPIVSPPTKLLVYSTGRACKVLADDEDRVVCENSGRLASLFALHSPSTWYKVSSAEDASFAVPLVNGGWTPRFPLRSDLQIVARAGTEEKMWRLDFAQVPGSSSDSNWLSSLQALSVFFFLPALLGISAVLFLALLTGQGGARNFSEVPVTALLFFQASFLLYLLQKVPDALQTNVSMLGWTALFLPLPSTAETNVELAAGCLTVSAVLLAMVSGLQVLFRLVLFDRKSREVLPHNMQLGNAELRLLHALGLPLAAAAAMLIADADTSGRLQAVGVAVVGFFVLLHLGLFLFVRRLVSDGRVAWLWNFPANAPDATGGRWCDTTVDQLMSEPVPWTTWLGAPTALWVSPAAQISPLTLGDPASLPGSRGGKEALVGSSAVAVTPRLPKQGLTLLPCLRDLPVGILRSRWLDVFFSLDALTKMLQRQKEKTSSTADLSDPAFFPLTVQRHQLTVPCVRFPTSLCARIGDSAFRSLLGLLLGFSLSLQGSIVAPILLLVASILCFSWMVYLRWDKPFHRRDENTVFPVLFGLLGLAALTCAGSEALRVPVLSTLIEHLSVYMLLALALYTSFTAVCLVLGAVWPAIQEIRLLPRQCNCALFLTDRRRDFCVVCPAYTRFPVRQVSLHCSPGPGAFPQVRRVPAHADAYAQLEFSVDDFRALCAGKDFEKPGACIFIDSAQSPLRFRSLTLYAGGDLRQAVDSLLEEEPAVRSTFPDLRNSLLDELERSQAGGSVRSIVVRLLSQPVGLFSAMPRHLRAPEAAACAEREASMEFSRDVFPEKTSSDFGTDRSAVAELSPLSSRSWRDKC